MLKQFTLSQDELRKNIELFQSTNEKYKIFSEELLSFLGNDIYTAPASTVLSLHNCFEGGLLDNMIRIAKYASNLNKLLPENLRQELETIVKVSFLSQIGKTFLYKPCESKWHKENQGKYYEFNETLISMRIGERSAHYCLTNNVILKDYEYQAILNHDKILSEDAQAKWHSDILSVILRQAIELSIIEEKERWKKIQ